MSKKENKLILPVIILSLFFSLSVIVNVNVITCFTSIEESLNGTNPSVYSIQYNSLNTVSVPTIWQIGVEDNSADEFGLPGSIGASPSINKEQFLFYPPEDPNFFDWKSFPCKIFTEEALTFNPKEIHIAYNYLYAYKGLYLRLRAKSATTNPSQQLVISLGDDIIANIPAPPSYEFETIDIPLGSVSKGQHDENTIVLKNTGNGSNAIFLDYLELYSIDKDGDGSLDIEEISGYINTDIDMDGIINEYDPDTATKVLKNRDQIITGQLTLDIEEDGAWEPYFTDMAFPDANWFTTLKTSPAGIFFPFSVIRSQIVIPEGRDILTFSIILPNDKEFFNNAELYIYAEDNWKGVPIEFVSKNIINVSIELKNMQNQYGLTDNENTYILTGAIGYPENLDENLQDRGLCFIRILE